MTNNTRRGILAALPFFGVVVAAPVIAQAAARPLSAAETDAKIRAHIDAIKELSGGKLNVVGFYAPAPERRAVTRAEAVAESKVAYWQERYPPNELLLLSNGQTVRIDYSQAQDAGDLSSLAWPGSPVVRMTSAGGTSSVKTLACHLPHNIIGRVL